MFSAINYWPITVAYIACRACVCCGLHYCHENPSNGSRDIDQIVRFSSWSAPLITDLSQPKLTLLANSLATVISEPALYRLLTFQVPNLVSLFRCLRCTKISVQVHGKCSSFVTKPLFTVRSCKHLAQPPSWRTTPCRLSAAAYSIYSHLPSILQAVPPSATCGRDMPWWE
jgi:hypothetical protein